MAENNREVLGIIAPHPPIMVPEVGRDRAHVTDASANAMAQARALLDGFDPHTLVLMSPHAPVGRDTFLIDSSPAFLGDLAQFGAPSPGIEAPGDPKLARAIANAAMTRDLSVTDRIELGAQAQPGVLDHGSMVPLSFLFRDDVRPLVVVSLAFLPLESHRELGRAIAQASRALGRTVAFLASGDCSHRLQPGAPAGYSPRAVDFDRELTALVSRGDYEGLLTIEPGLVDEAGECGLRSFVTLGGFLEGTDAETRLLAYEGPWGVGYMTAVAASPSLFGRVPVTPAAGEKGGSPGDDESPPVTLARRTIELYLRESKTPSSLELYPELTSQRAACFVSLHRHGALRGCIGTIMPTYPSLAEEIVHNAVQASTRDPRFSPMSADELDDLEVSVDILHPPESIESIRDLDPSRYGVVVSCEGRRGLLLPDLEGVDTAEQQVGIARRKGGILPHEDVLLERFRVERFH